MLCICCNKKIEPIYNEVSEEQLIFEKEKGIWNDGIVGSISAGYGSNKDGDIFMIAVCDECLSSKIETGTIALIDNYIEPVYSKESLKEHRELWKKFN